MGKMINPKGKMSRGSRRKGTWKGKELNKSK